ncbi:MAG: choice-of-anchor L domain-containing protein [Anaerolineae bacterium]|nr:choice-of-anchor L domain-containing protein [Anaerolineae bacterium]
MLFADQPNSGPNTFGLGDYARLALTFTVPVTATCLSMDFAFFSEEFPEFVGSQFNDTFDAFVDGQPIARDQNGNRISINSVFGATPGNALGTTYDAATPRLRARAALTPGRPASSPSSSRTSATRPTTARSSSTSSPLAGRRARPACPEPICRSGLC